MSERLGFIGLGNMGSRMARRLSTAPGAELSVFDVDERRIAEISSAHVTGALSPREVAERSDTVFLSLPNAEIVSEVLFGAEGVAAAERVRTVVDLSTIGEEAVVLHAGQLARAGVSLVDAPVSGGPRGAEKGTLTIMVAASETDLAHLRPHFDLLGKTVRLVSTVPGKAQVVKLINNMLSDVAMAVSAEALTFAEKAGLDVERVLEVVNEGSGRNSATEDKYAAQILSGDYNWGFAAGLVEKDMRLYVEHAQRYQATTLLAGSVHEVWRLHLNQHGPHADFTTIEKLYRHLNGQP